MNQRVPLTVLAALGLASGCAREIEVGPCLSAPYESGEEDTGDAETAAAASQSALVESVLASDVLPADVARKLSS